MDRLIIKNVNYNKYHEIFLFISKSGFKYYRKKDILINPRDYQYYSVNTFSRKKLVNIEIDGEYNKLYNFLHDFSDKYAYNKFNNKTYIKNLQIVKKKLLNIILGYDNAIIIS